MVFVVLNLRVFHDIFVEKILGPLALQRGSWEL